MATHEVKLSLMFDETAIQAASHQMPFFSRVVCAAGK
jgi:hypothetical protein